MVHENYYRLFFDGFFGDSKPQWGREGFTAGILMPVARSSRALARRLGAEKQRKIREKEA